MMDLKKKIIFMILISMPFPTYSGNTDFSGSEVQHAYTESIHEDISFIVEGIELFIKRDYPHLWKNIESGNPVAKETIARYISETSNFKTILDTHLKEFLSYLSSSGRIVSEPKEKEILQMLSYAYLSTGNFIISRTLIKTPQLMEHKVIMNISSIDGTMEKIDLTEKLVKRISVVDKNLGEITVDLEYFSQKDIQEIDAFIEVSESDETNPVNIMYATSYKGLFPYNEGQEKYKISLNSVFSFLNKIGEFQFSREKKEEFYNFKSMVFDFPMIKGSYGISLENNGLKLERLRLNRFKITKKCYFKGFEKTGLITSSEEKKVSLVNQDRIYKKNEYCDYGEYEVKIDDEIIGYIELIPCSKSICEEKKSSNPAVISLKAYDHKLVLFEDMIDQMKISLKQNPIKKVDKNLNSFIKNSDDSLIMNIEKTAPKVEKKEKKKTHLFMGCSPKKESFF